MALGVKRMLPKAVRLKSRKALDELVLGSDESVVQMTVLSTNEPTDNWVCAGDLWEMCKAVRTP